MRKVLQAFVVGLVLLGPALYAEDKSVSADDAAALFNTEPSEEGDSCRQECAEDGVDADECNQDCNTVA